MKTKIPNAIETGMAILKDFDKKTYAKKPAINAAMAVRVPVGKIAHAQAAPVIKTNILCDFILPHKNVCVNSISHLKKHYNVPTVHNEKKQGQFFHIATQLFSV